MTISLLLEMTPLGSINFNHSCVERNLLYPGSLKFASDWHSESTPLLLCNLLFVIRRDFNGTFLTLLLSSCFIIVIISVQWDQKINKKTGNCCYFLVYSILHCFSHCRTVVEWKTNQSVPFMYVSSCCTWIQNKQTVNYLFFFFYIIVGHLKEMREMGGSVASGCVRLRHLLVIENGLFMFIEAFTWTP